MEVEDMWWWWWWCDVGLLVGFHCEEVVGVVGAVVVGGGARLVGVAFVITRRPSFVRWTFRFVGVTLLS